MKDKTDEEKIEEQVEARRNEEVSQAGGNKTNDAAPNGITSAFIRKCVWEGESGDGALFAALYRDKLVFNNNSETWLVWQGHYWELDTMQQPLIMTKGVVDLYSFEISKIKEELKTAESGAGTTDEIGYLKNLLKAATARRKKMQDNAGKAACLKASVSIENPLSISGMELDLNPWLLACPNGVIDLETGNFEPGKQEQYLTMATNVLWPEKGLKSKAPRWRRFLSEIFNDDKEKIHYVLKALGYGLTGLKMEHFFMVWYGEHGRNGKGTIFNLMSHIMGDLAWPIPVEMLLKSKYGRNPSGPSPDIMSLKNTRIVFASEPDDGQKFDIGKIKYFTGGEPLTARAPHDKLAIRFDPTHTLIMLANEMPAAKASDDAFWERLVKITFPNSYVTTVSKPYHKKANKYLEKELKEEASEILADLVRHCLLWKDNGLVMPQSIKADTEEWRRNEDPLADFADECLEECDMSIRTKSALFYEVYKLWYQKNVDANEEYTPGPHKFGRNMAAKYKKCKTDSGRAGFKGVKIKDALPLEYAATLDE